MAEDSEQCDEMSNEVDDGEWDISDDDDDDLRSDSGMNRIKLQQISKKLNVFNFHYCYVLLLFNPSVV